MIPSEESMRALVGHRFPGGRYRIEHWENVLLSEATGIDPLPGDLAHPIHLFHVAINGVGISIAELFDLAGVTAGAPVSIDYYDWRIHRPLREDEWYTLRGGIAAFDRSTRHDGPTRDSFTYHVTMDGPAAAPVAEVEFRWHFWHYPDEGGQS